MNNKLKSISFDLNGRLYPICVHVGCTRTVSERLYMVPSASEGFNSAPLWIRDTDPPGRLPRFPILGCALKQRGQTGAYPLLLLLFRGLAVSHIIGRGVRALSCLTGFGVTSVISDPVCPQSLCCPHKQLILSCCQRGFGVTPQSEASPCPGPKAHRQSSLELLVLSPGLPSWCADPFLSRVPPRF